ncbi:hypothetical protein F5884DRAFT_297214 [Xylogone sp. PMI_703]|nr:hypothetical protein F5884DRAFT_297214 [Xylogone sp. PMI_703]
MTSAPPRQTLQQQPTIYPEYCHQLSPTIGRWCPLRAIDVHALQSVGCYVDGKELYHYRNHPIKWVRLTGVVVAIDDFSGWRVYSLDDSSGACIECSCAAPITPNPLVPDPIVPNRPGERSGGNKIDSRAGNAQQAKPPSDPNLPLESIDIGTVVKIKGGIGIFREQKRIEIKRIQVIRSTDEEVRCWDEVRAFLKDVVGEDWMLSEEEQKKCKRRWEREQRKGLKGRGTTEKRVKRAAEMETTGRNEQESLRVEMERAEREERERERQRQRESELGRDDRITRRHEYTEREMERRRQKQRSKSGKGKENEKGRSGSSGASTIRIPAVAMSRIAGKYDALGL